MPSIQIQFLFFSHSLLKDAEPFNSILLSRNLSNNTENVIHLSTENVKDINRTHYFALIKEKKEDKGIETLLEYLI